MKRRIGPISIAAAMLVVLLFVPQVALADEPSIEADACPDINSIAQEICAEQQNASVENSEVVVSSEESPTSEDKGLLSNNSETSHSLVAELSSENGMPEPSEISADEPISIAAPVAESANAAVPSPQSSGSVGATAQNLKQTVVRNGKDGPELITQSGGDISEGPYVIKVTTTYGSALSVSGNRGAGAVKVDGIDGNYDQIFFFQSVSSDLYSIFSLCSGLALDTSSSDLRQVAYTGSNHQLFKAIKAGDRFTFVSKAGRAIAVSGSTVKTASYDSKHPASQKLVLIQAPLVIPGVHVLYTASNTNAAATIENNSRSTGIQGKATSYTGADGQKMLVARKGQGYEVKPVCSGLDLAPSSNTVTQQSKSFVWSAKFTTGGTRRGVALVDTTSGKAVQTESGKLVVSASKLNAAQAFLLARTSVVSDGLYVVKNLISGNVLDIANGSWRSGANIQLWSSNGTGAQAFNVKDMGFGLCRIENAMTGYVIAAPGSNAYQAAYNGSSNQLWVPVASPSGGIVWINAATGKALNASGTAAGSNVAASGANGSGYQAWSLVKTTYAADYVLRTAMRNAISFWSSTNYQIMVDRDNCRTVVVWWDGSDWKPLYNWTCSPGASETPTVGGSYTIGIRGYSFSGALGGDPYTCYYYTQFWGDYLFHSIPYHQGTWSVQDGRLGQKLSHGCVRLATENAKWIYDNIPDNTHVYVYN